MINAKNKNKVIIMKELKIRLSILAGVLILISMPNIANANKNPIEEPINYQYLIVEETIDI